MKKITIKRCNITGALFDIELEPERILCNDVVFPWESHPHGMKLWLIGNEYGCLCAVWANNEQDALDEGVDKGLLDSFLVSKEDEEKMDEDEREELSHLGNAGESADLTNLWMSAVDLSVQTPELLCAFAEARGANADTLDK